MTSSIPVTNLSARLCEGRKLARTQHVEKEAGTVGNLRAGNSGVMDSGGQVAGSCHRRAHLRQLGFEVEPPTDSQVLMFQMGTANEQVVYDDLRQTASANEVILRETEIPISWLTANGTKVTGRPDMVVCRKVPVAESEPAARLYPTERDGLVTPLYGIEIKSIASVWTSRDVLFGGSPKIEHLIQAAHYAWKLGCPFRLLYKQYSKQSVPSWADRYFPKKGEPHSEHIEYNDQGKIKGIQPFEIVYELETTPEGFVKYRRESQGGKEQGEQWTKSLVRVSDIERFYEFTSRMAEDKQLGPRPLTITAGGEDKNWSLCDYCPLQPVCDKHESKGYTKWLAAARKELSNGKK